MDTYKEACNIKDAIIESLKAEISDLKQKLEASEERYAQVREGRDEFYKIIERRFADLKKLGAL